MLGGQQLRLRVVSSSISSLSVRCSGRTTTTTTRSLYSTTSSSRQTSSSGTSYRTIGRRSFVRCHERTTARRIFNKHQQFRFLATTTSPSPSSTEKLRVAVVGGGCAGLSAALHLAPLAEAGLIASPIDVFDATTCKYDTSRDKGGVDGFDNSGVGAGSTGRDIGVGIWSTALDPLLIKTDSSQSSSSTPRTSHELAYEEMTRRGTWVGDVGYRTPDGAWLMQSHLPTSRNEQTKTGLAGLLFLREKDMLASLQKAVAWEEEERGTISVHRTTPNEMGQPPSSRVERLEEDSHQPWSTRLIFKTDDSDDSSIGNIDSLSSPPPPCYSERDYHLIVAADGTNSVLRKLYGGHDTATRNVLTGGKASSSLSSPIELPPHVVNAMEATRGNAPGASGSHQPSPPTANHQQHASDWNEASQQEAVGLQDRHYTVFRGNAKITQEELLKNNMDGERASFQTWGKGHSMRFATVPMFYPADDSKSSEREERQVWFITIDNDEIAQESDATKRRDLLLKQFQDWHDPIKQLVLATDPDDTLVERAIAHRHCMGPVLSLNQVITRIRGPHKRPPNSGEGPAIVFLGDAYMTIDPILAQGFTVAMEGAYELRNSVENSCRYSSPQQPSMAFDPMLLRRELKLRHHSRLDRLVCLLRATELVQALGQPSGGTIGGFLNTHLLRPLTKLIPNFIKKPIFDAVLNYSLGLPPPNKVIKAAAKKQEQQSQQEKKQ